MSHNPSTADYGDTAIVQQLLATFAAFLDDCSNPPSLILKSSRITQSRVPNTLWSGAGSDLVYDLLSMGDVDGQS